MLARIPKRSFTPNFTPAAMSFSLSFHRPIHWKATAPEPLPNSTTFAAQKSLPILPVPDLDKTLARLKESLRPISWNEAEYEDVVRKIDEFAKSKGPELQSRLLDWAKKRDHWLEEWWDDGAYLNYRDSVVVNVSYYCTLLHGLPEVFQHITDGFDPHPSHLKQTSAARAAGIARAAMIFRQRLKQGLLKPDATKEGPLCMDTYRWMFDCCRVPGPEGFDWSVTYAKQGDLGDSGHIIVFRKNRVWKVDATRDGQILSTDQFEKQMQYIYDNSTHEYPGVGVLTASNRDVWAKDFRNLTSSSHNAQIIDAIHSAAFCISLDSSTPTTDLHHSRALWHGDITKEKAIGLRNRWVDKPVQFIVFDNGFAGIMGEHSVMDGTPTVRLCDEVLDMLADPKFDHGSATSSVIPQPLDWEISPTIEKAIAAADVAAIELINSQELGFHLTSYGKAAIKKFGVSPDSWAQMIVQLAYRRLLEKRNEKRKGGTYEAATTRRFYKGRTEAIRVVTNESDAWVRSMDEQGVSTEEKKRLFDLATKKHVELAKSGGLGQGVDRHLLGLKKMIKATEEAPSLFSDPILVRSSYWVLSTSAVFSKHFDVYGWGEVVPDGFGVAYMTGFDERLQYTITSRKEMPNAEFCRELGKAAVDLYTLHAEVQKCRL